MSASYNEMAGRLMVALDYPDAKRAKALVRQPGGHPVLYEGRHAAVLRGRS